MFAQLAYLFYLIVFYLCVSAAYLGGVILAVYIGLRAFAFVVFGA